MLSVCLQADTKALNNQDFNPVNIRMVIRTHSLRSPLMLPPLLTRHLPPNPISRTKILTTEQAVPLPTPFHPYPRQSVVATITTMGILTGGSFIHRLPRPQQFRKQMEIRGDRTCNHNLPRFMVQRCIKVNQSRINSNIIKPRSNIINLNSNLINPNSHTPKASKGIIMATPTKCPARSHSQGLGNYRTGNKA